jgi:hypothetical protein
MRICLWSAFFKILLAVDEGDFLDDEEEDLLDAEEVSSIASDIATTTVSLTSRRSP